MIQLKTRWEKKVDKKKPLLEYPRPNFVRDSYFNLNGEWEYCINRERRAENYDGTIIVPYSPETLLSGVGKIVMPNDYLHYRKTFTLPKNFKKDRVLLNFGAVDQECVVMLNGERVGAHKGGYNSFHFDITKYLVEGENVLTLCVRDMTEKKPHARGKQKLVKKGKYASLFYTPQSGIWKTVWMESVPNSYVERVRITPMYDESAVKVHIYAKTAGETVKKAVSNMTQEANPKFVQEAAQKSIQETTQESLQRVDKKTATVAIFDEDGLIKEVRIAVNKDVVIPLETFQAWTPDTPNLYDLKIKYGNDEVGSYFGMRKFSVERDSKGILRFFMNNKPVFFNGVLDQGYWPESLLTPPTDEALKYDIIKLKQLGFNMIRKHIKVEPERFYYHCDKIGMFVWQDMPNGGGDYNMVFVTYLTNAFDWFARGVKDNHYKLFKRTDEEGRKQYYKDLRGMIEELYNYPSIAVWVPFNEGWGQFDAREATKLIRSLDESRFINEACGWFDQKGGDMYSIHNYSPGLEICPQKDRVVALTEFGGYAFAMPGHISCEKEFGYKSFHSKEELTKNYKTLWENEIYPNLENGLSSTVYTQTSDIEEEINGIMTYDRDEVKFIEEEICELNKKLYHLFEEVV